MKLDRELIDKAILDIKKLQLKYCKRETMFVAHRLGEALNKIGWNYAEFIAEELVEEVMGKREE